MKNLSRFQKIVGATFAVLTSLIIIFIFLNTFTHPRVVQVSLAGGNESAAIKNQQIRITFNRPIKKDNIAQFVTITPELKFRDLWNANTLVLIPDSTLDSQTTYTLNIKKEITDIYGENFTDDYSYTFKTEIPRFAVIEKTENSTIDSIAIYNADLSNRQEIVKRNNIKFYGINDNFLVLVTENNFSDDIEVINRITNESRKFGLTNTNIASFSFSNSTTRNEFAYTKQDIEVKGTYYIPKTQSKIYIYSLDTQSEVLFNPENTATDVASIEYSQDGVSLLYKTGDSFYNLAETNNQSNYSSIGRFLAEGNFNYDNTSIVFVAYDPLNTYSSNQFLSVFDSSRVTTNMYNQDVPVLDPQFKHKSNQIVYAEKYKDLETTKGIYKIIQTDVQGNKSDIVESSKYSLELPLLSYDDRYISMEQYSEEVLKDFKNTRSLGFQNKPSIATIVVYDTVQKKVFDNNIKGIDVKWL